MSGQVSADGHNPHVTKTVNIKPGFFTSAVRDPLTTGMAKYHRTTEPDEPSSVRPSAGHRCRYGHWLSEALAVLRAAAV
jgi:hypothetical protein